MSDQSVLDQLKISQSMRFYWYEYRLPPPIPQDEIVRHSTNIHIIPANDSIASACESLRAGELIHLQGELVEATGPGIGTWRSSLRRDDTGNGACELLLVEEFSRIDADSASAAKRLAHVTTVMARGAAGPERPRSPRGRRVRSAKRRHSEAAPPVATRSCWLQPRVACAEFHEVPPPPMRSE